MITRHNCEHELETLLKNVKSKEGLDLIDIVIEKLQDQFKVDLIKYKHQVQKMREEYETYHPHSHSDATGFYK